MRKWSLICIAVLAIAACTHGKPVYNVDTPMPAEAQRLPLDRIEALIIDAGKSRDWIFKRVEPGHLLATQSAPKYEAVVDIYFDDQRYRIVKNRTRGFDDTGGTIHAHYNLWIRNLEHDIDARLSNATATPK